MDTGQKRTSVFDRLGSRILPDNQAFGGEGPSHVSVIVSAPPAAVARKPSTSSESGSCTTTDEEEITPSLPPHTEYKISTKTRGTMFNRINVNQRRVSSPTLSKSAPLARLSSHPSNSRERTSLTPPHLRDKRGLMYDRHGNLRVPLAEKAKSRIDTSRPNSSSPSTASSSGTQRRTVNSPTDYRQYYLEYQRSKSKDVVESDVNQRSNTQVVSASSTRIRSNRPPFLRQNSREGESPSHSSRPSRGSSVCSSSSQRGSVIVPRKSRLERSSLAGDVSPISASGSTFSDFEDGQMTSRKRGRLEAAHNPESKAIEEGEGKKAIVLSDLSDGEFTGDEAGEVVEAAVSDLDSISDNELTEIIGESDPLAGDSSDQGERKQNVYKEIEIDWSSLIASTPKVDVKSMSARKRYTAANILSRIGFSSQFAGELLTKKIQDFCRKEGVRAEESEKRIKVEPARMTRCFHQILPKKKEEGNLLFPNRKVSFVCPNI